MHTIRPYFSGAARLVCLGALLVACGLSSSAASYSFNVVAPSSVYAGDTLYIQLLPVLPSSVTSLRIYYRTVTIAGAPAPYALSCRAFDCPKDSLGRYYDTATIPAWVVLRVNVPQTPGTYSVAFATEAGGTANTTNVPLIVKPKPQPMVASAYLSSTPIPNLAKWETTMTQLGAKWCQPTELMAFGTESQVWFYDGARVFYQIADYTGDRSWERCALNIAQQYRDYVIGANGAVPGWRVFTKGLLMAYQRTGDASYRKAIALIAKNAVAINWSTQVSDIRIREVSYVVNAMVDAERAGEPRSPHLARLVDYLLGHFDRLFVSHNYAINQLFFDGLGSEALINYYELTKDPRIPPTVKIMLDWVWDVAWNKSTYKLVINPDPLSPKCDWGCQKYNTELIALTVPGFGWYWRLSGDPVYQQRGDEMFSHALDTPIAYSGKVFSQNYHWSPDYVTWRTVQDLKPSDITIGVKPFMQN
jgi:hypothetical protein